MRIAILGNSGSGKSTLAASIAQQHQLDSLDLDTVYWRPDQPGVPQPAADAAQQLSAFINNSDQWVVEGCYERLIGETLIQQPTLLWVDPGLAVCQAHCRARPWEPHKYPSKAAQDQNLPALLDWVAEYYERNGEMSLKEHRKLYDNYAGPKHHITNLSEIPSRRLPKMSTRLPNDS